MLTRLKKEAETAKRSQNLLWLLAWIHNPAGKLCVGEQMSNCCPQSALEQVGEHQKWTHPLNKPGFLPRCVSVQTSEASSSVPPPPPGANN